MDILLQITIITIYLSPNVALQVWYEKYGIYINFTLVFAEIKWSILINLRLEEIILVNKI